MNSFFDMIYNYRFLILPLIEDYAGLMETLLIKLHPPHDIFIAGNKSINGSGWDFQLHEIPLTVQGVEFFRELTPDKCLVCVMTVFFRISAVKRYNQTQTGCVAIVMYINKIVELIVVLGRWHTIQCFCIKITAVRYIGSNHISMPTLTHLPPWKKWQPFWQTTFSNAFLWMKMIEFKFKFHWNVSPIDNKATLVQVMAWCRTGDKPLPEAMLIQFIDTYMRH